MPSRLRMLPLLAAALLAGGGAAPARAAEDPFAAVAYEAPDASRAALAKQAATLRERLAAASDDAARARTATAFLDHLDRIAERLDASGHADYAAEVRGYRDRVRAYRDGLLRAEAEAPAAADPFPDPGKDDDPFAGETAAPSVPRPAPRAPTAADDDPFAGEATAAGGRPATSASAPRKFLVEASDIAVEADSRGVHVGPFHAGDLLVLRYASGEWTSRGGFAVKPDVPRVDARERLVVLAPDGPDGTPGAVTEVPGQTDSAPFVYTVEEDGEVALRIAEPPGDDNENLFDNDGSVVYAAYVVDAADAEAFRASDEGRRCQFAPTAEERRAAEETARPVDPFAVDSSKQDGGNDFDFTKNDGVFTIRAQGAKFETVWRRGPDGDTVFASAERVRQVGGKRGFKRIPQNAKGFSDLVFAPGSRPVRKGEVVVFQNGEGRLLAVRVDDIRLPSPATGAPGRLSIHWRVY